MESSSPSFQFQAMMMMANDHMTPDDDDDDSLERTNTNGNNTNKNKGMAIRTKDVMKMSYNNTYYNSHSVQKPENKAVRATSDTTDNTTGTSTRSIMSHPPPPPVVEERPSIVIRQMPPKEEEETLLVQPSTSMNHDVIDTVMNHNNHERTLIMQMEQPQQQQQQQVLLSPTLMGQPHNNTGPDTTRSISLPEATNNTYSHNNRDAKSKWDQEDEKKKQAFQYLQAGQAAMRNNAGPTVALQHLKQADALLDARRKWVDDYQLALDICNAMAETYCCLAQFTEMDLLVDAILQNARVFDDKLRAYMLRIYSLGSLSRLQEAIQLCLQVLKKLGQRFPKRRTLPDLIVRYLAMQRKLSKLSDQDIMNLPNCSDPKKLAVMGVLNLLTTSAYIADQPLFPFLAIRMVSITLQHGLSAVSICGFASYGLLVCGVQDFDGGNRFGQLAIQLLERYDAVRDHWLPRAYMYQYGIIGLWTQPMRNCFPRLEEAREVGLQRDIESAWIANYLHGTHLFSVGEPLPKLEPFLRDSIAGMRRDQQDIWAEAALLNHEACLLLMGREDDPIVANGALQNVNKRSPKLQQVQAVANLDFGFYICEAGVQSMMAHYHRGDFAYALEMAEISRKAFDLIPAAQLGPYQAFYHGLVAISILRNYNGRPSLLITKRQWTPGTTKKLSRRAKWKLLRQTEKSLKMFQRFVKKACPENFLDRALLLEAELAAWNGKLDLALTKYTAAEAAAGEQKHFDIQGLACERAALTCWEFGRGGETMVNQHLERAIAVYQEWGAWAVVDRAKRLLFSSSSQPSTIKELSVPSSLQDAFVAATSDESAS